MSYGAAGNVHSYAGSWGEIILDLHHPQPLPPHVRDAIVRLLADALVEDFKRNPPTLDG